MERYSCLWNCDSSPHRHILHFLKRSPATLLDRSPYTCNCHHALSCQYHQRAGILRRRRHIPKLCSRLSPSRLGTYLGQFFGLSCQQHFCSPLHMQASSPWYLSQFSLRSDSSIVKLSFCASMPVTHNQLGPSRKELSQTSCD